MKRYILLSLLSVTMFFSSCEKDINIDFPVAPSPYVIEGYIENGQGPFVTVSRGISFINKISKVKCFVGKVVIKSLNFFPCCSKVNN